MKVEVRNDRDELQRVEDRTPECGEHFCDRCGDCLACFGEDYCDDPPTEHRWILYVRTED